MTLTNLTAGIIIFGYVFAYFVMYQNNKLYGNLMFVGLSIMILFAGNNTNEQAVAFMLLVGSIANLVKDLLNRMEE